jgi:hypothetical protein
MSKETDRAALATAMSKFTRDVTRVDTGVRALDMTDRQWAMQVRQPKATAIDPVDERYEVVDHLGVSHFRNGLGEWIS